MTWMVTQDAEYSVECQTSMSTFGVFIFKQKKKWKKMSGPLFRLLLRAFVTAHPEKKPSPHNWGGLLYIYKFYSFLRRYNFFSFLKRFTIK